MHTMRWPVIELCQVCIGSFIIAEISHRSRCQVPWNWLLSLKKSEDWVQRRLGAYDIKVKREDGEILTLFIWQVNRNKVWTTEDTEDNVNP